MKPLHKKARILVYQDVLGKFYRIERPGYPEGRIPSMTTASHSRLRNLLENWPGSKRKVAKLFLEWEYTYDPAQHAPDRPLHFSPTARGNVASGPDELMTE